MSLLHVYEHNSKDDLYCSNFHYSMVETSYVKLFNIFIMVVYIIIFRSVLKMFLSIYIITLTTTESGYDFNIKIKL